MLLPSHCKRAAAIGALAGTVLLGLTGALAAANPGPTRPTEGWRLAEPAFTIIDKDKSRQRKTEQWLKKNTRPLGTLKQNPGASEMRKNQPGPPDMRKVSPGPPDMRKGNPGPPETRKVNPGLPAVQ
jgi:hypothetical protein